MCDYIRRGKKPQPSKIACLYPFGGLLNVLAQIKGTYLPKILSCRQTGVFFPKGKAEKQKRILSSKILLFVFNLKKEGLVKLGPDGFQMQILQVTLGELDIVFESD